jgi:putative ABC transport system permease protein
VVPVARRNLLTDPGRLVMSVAGVAFAVLLILLVTSLYRGWTGFGSVFLRLPGDLWVAQRGTTDPLNSTSSLPAGETTRLGRLPGVTAVTTVRVRQTGVAAGDGRLRVFLMSLEPPAGAVIPPQAREQFLPPAGHINIDRVLADAAGVGPGDRINVLGRQLIVDQIHTGGNRLLEIAYVNAADAKALYAVPGRVSFYLLTLSPGADPALTAQRAQAAIPGSEVHSSAEYARAFAELINQGFLPVVGALVGIGFVVGGALIALTIYTATAERSRDFGVLKALGASAGFLYGIVLRQSLLVGTAGAIAGAGASAVAATLIRRYVPEFVTDLRPLDVAGVLITAIALSVVAAYVPVRRVNAIDPALVFRV